MHSTSVRESLIESPVILSPSKPQNIVSATTHSFEYPAILSLPKHCFVCFRWRRRLSTLQFYSLSNRVDAVSSFAKDLRTLQFYSPPSHKASAATQSACLRILQSPFQAGNSSAHQKIRFEPCNFTSAKPTVQHSEQFFEFENHVIPSAFQTTLPRVVIFSLKTL